MDAAQLHLRRAVRVTPRACLRDERGLRRQACSAAPTSGRCTSNGARRCPPAASGSPPARPALSRRPVPSRRPASGGAASNRLASMRTRSPSPASAAARSSSVGWCTRRCTVRSSSRSTAGRTSAGSSPAARSSSWRAASSAPPRIRRTAVARRAARQPAQVPLQLVLDDLLRGGQVVGQPASAGQPGGSQVGQVDQPHPGQRPDRRVDVARHRQVHERQRPGAARPRRPHGPQQRR